MLDKKDVEDYGDAFVEGAEAVESDVKEAIEDVKESITGKDKE